MIALTEAEIAALRKDNEIALLRAEVADLRAHAEAMATYIQRGPGCEWMTSACPCTEPDACPVAAFRLAHPLPPEPRAG